MKVLHVTTVDFGGAGLCCLRIHESLLDNGIESKVVTVHNTKHATEEYEFGYLKNLLSRSIAKVMRLIGLPMNDRSKLGAMSQRYHATFSLPVSSIDITQSKWIEWADIIHLHWVNNYLDYPSFFKKVKKPIVWTLHDENLFYGVAHHHVNIMPNHPLEIKYRQVKYDAVRNAENLTIVFLSEMMLGKFGNDSIIEGKNKAVINNSVNTSIFRPYDRDTMRQKYGIEKQKTVFLFIAFDICDPNKGLNVLSETLFRIDPDAEILAIGGNPSNKKWDNVRSVGLVNDKQKLVELMSCANFFTMPSYQEAFSQSPIEAMACGLPAVVFPVSGTQELINKGNGVVCDGFTSEALYDGIKALMSRHYNPISIRQDIIARFSQDVIAQKYISLYKTL